LDFPTFSFPLLIPIKPAMDAVTNAIESATKSATSGGLAETSRVALLDAATKLVNALQKPEDAITRLAWWVRGPILPMRQPS
jgi:hypothetical protein